MNTPANIQLSGIIPEELSGKRLDQALSKMFTEHSRARLQSWIRSGGVTVDGNTLKPSDKVKAGQAVNITGTVEAPAHWEAEEIPLDIVFEDNDIIVVNKPAGLVVHPGSGNPKRTLINALLHHAPELAEVTRAGIVHRIDKGTTGLLVVAKTLAAHTALVQQIQAHEAKREYLAVVNGVIISGASIDAPIARHITHRTKMAVVENGKSAVTHYRVKEKYRAHTLINVQLETGRTHQIRVHMAHVHYPLVGDPVYGGRLQIAAGMSEDLSQYLRQFKRQALHAQRLSLQHPISGEAMSWEAPIPEDMQKLIALLREDTP